MAPARKHRLSKMDPGGTRNPYPQKNNRFETDRSSNRACRFHSNGSCALSEASGHENSSSRSGFHSSNKRPHGDCSADSGQASNTGPAANQPLSSRARGHKKAGGWEPAGGFRRPGTSSEGRVARSTVQPVPGHGDGNGIPDSFRCLSLGSWDRPEGGLGSQIFQDADNRSPLHHQEGDAGYLLGRYPIIDNGSQTQLEPPTAQPRDLRGSNLASDPAASSLGIYNVDRRLEEASRWLEENIRPSLIVGQHHDTESLHLTSAWHRHHSVATKGPQRFTEDITSQSAAIYKTNSTSSLIPYLEIMAAECCKSPTAAARPKGSKQDDIEPKAQYQEPLERRDKFSTGNHPAGQFLPAAGAVPIVDNHPKRFPKSGLERGKKPQAEFIKEAAREALLTRIVFPDDGYKSRFYDRVAPRAKARDFWD
ncbi:unnamed protein product [Tuber aestivum]|uniref:Uncharacterized protein n=1 Tax=Tuber aestivum TaxID=59557 RepID=A0A292Q288_9PEZI|nr:unnamed protein product [Tuber aestivum]